MHMDINRIILGCGNFGGVGSLPELYGQGDSEEQAARVLDAALEAGIRAFDTAHSYGGGRSEEYLGRWLRSLPAEIRDTLKVTSKVGNPSAALPGKRPLEASEITRQVATSLGRLGLSALEVLYLHETDPATPWEETMTALSQELRSGRCRYIGLSNVKLPEARAALAALERADSSLLPRLRFVQNEFHFLDDDDSRVLIPFLRARGILYVSFSPLAGGMLSGKYKANTAPPEGSRLALRPGPYVRFQTSESFAKIETLAELAEQNCSSMPREALRFVFGPGHADLAVIGVRNTGHLRGLGLLSHAQSGSPEPHVAV